eukprot:TRINITY_DN594_c0_g1_i3.p1 TRINITY_DN594_c0_g1~~TRINITY_DN594_c0_g1_i3.p1  ORF type:complete len:518 (-),score=93.30 TRINITY_DN594_c0_g1_i3:50-1603(-)
MVLKSLNCIHEQLNACHLDVKPLNIFVCLNSLGHPGSPSFQLGDNQTLQHLAEHEWLRLPKPAGTPNYVAPEMLEECAASKFSDIHSFGVVVWELFFGRTPSSNELSWLRNESPEAVAADIDLDSVIFDPIQALETFKLLPVKWRMLIHQCVGISPVERGTTNELLQKYWDILMPAGAKANANPSLETLNEAQMLEYLENIIQATINRVNDHNLAQQASTSYGALTDVAAAAFASRPASSWLSREQVYSFETIRRSREEDTLSGDRQASVPPSQQTPEVAPGQGAVAANPAVALQHLAGYGHGVWGTGRDSAPVRWRPQPAANGATGPTTIVLDEEGDYGTDGGAHGAGGGTGMNYRPDVALLRPQNPMSAPPDQLSRTKEESKLITIKISRRLEDWGIPNSADPSLSLCDASQVQRVASFNYEEIEAIIRSKFNPKMSFWMFWFDTGRNYWDHIKNCRANTQPGSPNPSLSTILSMQTSQINHSMRESFLSLCVVLSRLGLLLVLPRSISGNKKST